MGINRTTQSLLAALVLLAAAFGIAEADQPTAVSASGPGAGATPLHAQVQTSSLVCPPPQGTSSASTRYALTAPGPAPDATSNAAAGSEPDSAALTPVAAAGAGAGKPLATLGSPGGQTTAKAAAGSAAVSADGSGRLAPGLTVEQTTTSSRALTGTACTAPGTDFWFAGTSAAQGRADRLLLTNTESVAASVSVQLFGPDGEADNTTAADLTVQPGSTLDQSIGKLVNGAINSTDLAAHVMVHSGRVAASLYADDGSSGADWIPATQAGSTVTVPGLPGDTKDARLIVADPGEEDADLKVQLASQTGWITPAGHETVHVSAGSATVVDLGAVTHGQPATLRLSPSGASGAVPVVAGVRVGRGSDESWLGGSAAVGARATVAGLQSGATLLLTASGPAASVKLDFSGAGGKTVQIQPGATTAVPVPSGATAATLTPSSPAVYAARLQTASGGLFTLQPLPYDRSAVTVPAPTRTRKPPRSSAPAPPRPDRSAEGASKGRGARSSAAPPRGRAQRHRPDRSAEGAS
ncbi:DUF5719 family protein [Phaeacidiphilus oryzae]|uniref:DUF5719 family protein n=1 Tax=Phaeacidiphilus oryzae TaxID=348818 RepID=UPI00068E77EB|nr:DUF5719 family protein [Phaeacidiphilus oryzae]